MSDILDVYEFDDRVERMFRIDRAGLAAADLRAHDRALRAERDRYKTALERIVRGEEEAPVGRLRAALTLFLKTCDEWRGASQVFVGDFQQAEDAARAALAGPDPGRPFGALQALVDAAAEDDEADPGGARDG